jgi:hypothetical protein
VDSVPDVSEIHVASIFRVEVCKVGEFPKTSTRCEYPRADRQYKSRMSSSGMWRCVDLASTDVSEERITSIFRPENSASGEPAWAGGATCMNCVKPLYYSYPALWTVTLICSLVVEIWKHNSDSWKYNGCIAIWENLFFYIYLPIYNLLNRNKVISKCGICLCLEGGNYPEVVLIHFKYLSPLASVSKVFVH